MKKIVMTGGGTAGHVTPNIALFPRLRQMGYDIEYIGSHNGIEKQLIKDCGIPYHGISSGKLRRYLDLKNLSDPFKVLGGLFQARRLLRGLKPDIVFSKGGFVSVPVVLAAKQLKIPAIIHESDLTPGLANKLAIPAAIRVCCNFPETLAHLPEGRAVLTGSPIRSQLLEGNRERALKFTGLSAQKPVLLVVGGSTGSKFINDTIRGILPVLLKDYHLIHLCGRGNLDSGCNGMKGYVQYEYSNRELADLLALADIVISRAGANAIFELLELRKLNILIPLSANASRGDQILNAKSFKKQGYSYVIEEENLSEESLLKGIRYVSEHKETYVDAMTGSRKLDPVTAITNLIDQYRKPSAR